MQTCSDLHTTLNARGITLETNGSVIRVRPKGSLTSDEAAFLRTHKAAIIEALMSEKAGEALGETHPATAQALGIETSALGAPQSSPVQAEAVPVARTYRLHSPEVLQEHADRLHDPDLVHHEAAGEQLVLPLDLPKLVAFQPTSRRAHREPKAPVAPPQGRAWQGHDPTSQCRVCGSRKWNALPGSTPWWICAVCHPPVDCEGRN